MQHVTHTLHVYASTALYKVLLHCTRSVSVLLLSERRAEAVTDQL